MTYRRIVKEQTHSLCLECLATVPAVVYIEGSSVFMEKRCPSHGNQISLIEKDPQLYLKLYHKTADGPKFPLNGKGLIVPVEYSCNLNCIFCYLPNRTKENIPLDDLKRIVSNFKGGAIELSGGEPTLREDLPEIIRMVKSFGKECGLSTNGIKLADRNYLLKLKEAGLDRVFMSLYSIDNEIEKKICGKDILDIKLDAIKAIKEAGICITLSLTVINGLNEDEIKGVFDLAVKNGVRFIAIRSVGRVGKYDAEGKVYLSDILNSISTALNIGRDELISARRKHCAPYVLYVVFLTVKGGSKIYLYSGFISKVKALIGACKEIGLIRVLALILGGLWGRNIFHPTYVRIASWPDINDFDIDEADYGKFEHLYQGEKNLTFFEAMIRNDGL